MGTQLWTWTVWLFILYGTTSTVTGAAPPTTCKQECPSTSRSVFHYQDGHKYTYNLEGTTTTTLPGAQGDISKLQLKATVELSVQSACSHLVKLKGVQIIGAGGKKYGSLKKLEAHPVLANFQSGVINSQLCTEAGDDKAALNLKRAVLSLLQVSAPAGSSSSVVREVDVFGICPTEITSSKDGDIVTVKKSRNLNKCSHREDLRQEVLSTPFVGNADWHSTPLLESTYSSEQQIKNGIISNAVSHETYLYRPFSRQGNGAKTTVETKLSLVSDKPQAANVPASINVPQSIIFEAPHLRGSTATSSKEAILQALHAAGDTMKTSVETESAGKFRALVEVLRDSSREDILSVYGQVKAGAGFSNKQAARKLLLDGIFRAGTGDSVVAAVELLKSHEITGDQTKLWYMSLAFARHISPSSIDAVSNLLDDPAALPREGILAIGALAGRFCRENNCENVPQLNALLGKLTKLIKLKVKSIKEENNVIVILKTLANIHHLNDAAAEKVKQVASDKSLPARVRVAALETFQSDACHSGLRKSALDILSDHLEDSEVRIKAYLALVECPSGSLANSLKELLEKEPTNQVGSYIVSHLRNLRASTNPAKEEAKQHLRNLKPRKHFPEDFRKFSHNQELSYILDGLNIGNSIESNVIFSQNSYIPRSVNFNLTTEIFGHSYNVLELSSRTENADKILESYLGPNGYLNKHSWDELLAGIVKYGKQLKNKIEERVRVKRSLNHDELDKIKNEVLKSLPPSHDGEELILDLSLKLFGSELMWINLDQGIQKLSVEGLVDSVFDLLQGAVNKAKNFKYEVRNHCTFLDSELIYPTGLGFSLNLDVSGSTAVHLMLSGQIDLPALLQDAPNTALNLDVRPSATIDIHAAMFTHTPVEDSGLKVAYTLHTDTGLSIAVKDLDNTGIDINVGLPVKKQDILTVKTDILSVVHEHGHKEVDTPVVFNINRKEYEGCFDQASPLVGLTLCTKVGFPYDLQGRSTALYPLNGPSILSLGVESDDVSSYHFKALVNDKDPNHQSLEILFETPDSKIDRRLELLLQYDAEPNKEAKISLKSPWKTLVLQGTYVDSNQEQSLTAKFLDDANEYSLKIGARVEGGGNHQTYTPILEYKAPSQKGRLATKGTKTSARATQSYNVKGTVTVDKQGSGSKMTFNKVSLKTPQGDIEIDGTIARDVGSFSSDVKVSYGQEHIILKSKLQKVGDNHYKIAAGVVPSKQKDLGLGITWEYEYNPNELRNEVIIVHGSDLKSETNRITINQQLHVQVESVLNFDISTKNSLTYPVLNVDMRFVGNAKPNNLNYNLHLGYDKHLITSELHSKRDIKKPGDYDVAFMLHVLNSTLRVNSNREILGPDRSMFKHLLELAPIVKYELSTDVTHKYQQNNINLQLLAILKVDDNPKQYELDSGLIHKPNLLDTHAKLKIGPDTVLDTALLINDEDSNKPHGNMKVYIKEYLEATSEFNFNKGGGQASFKADLPKINRKLRGNIDLTITGTVHVGKAELYWNPDNDPKQSIIIQTTTDVKPDAIDSKNTIQIVDQNIVLNLKGALTGKVTDGHLIANGDLILNNGRQFTVKYDETLHVRPTNSEGRVEIVLIDIPKKGSKPRRLSIEAAAKDVDPDQMAFEGGGKLEYKCPEGKDVKIVVQAKNIPQGERNVIGAEANIKGSYIPQEIKAKIDAEVSKAVITYKGSGSYGSDSSLTVAGGIRTGLGGTSPQQIDNTIEIKLPSEPLKQVKLVTVGSLSVPKENHIELTTSNVLTWNNDQTVKLDGELSGGEQEGSAKASITLPKENPRSIAVSWSDQEESAAGIVKEGTLILADGDKEIRVAAGISIPPDQKSYKLKIVASTPLDKLKKLDLNLASKELETPARHIETDAVLVINDKTITVDSKIGLAPGVPMIDLTVVHPVGTSKLYLNVDKLTEDELKMQTKVQWAAYGGGTLTSDGEIKLSVDDFKIMWNIDSPELKINKWHVEAGNKAVKGSKKIVFSVVAADKTVLSGSSTLRSKSDGNLITYDGAGVVEIGEQNQRFNFKIERLQLNQDTDGETGIKYKGSVKVGQKEVEGLLKITNKEFHYLQSFCPKNDDCAVVEAKSKLNIADVTEVEQENLLKIDLKTLDIPYGVNMKSKTTRHGINLDHGFDLQLNNKDHQTKYSYKVVINEKNSGITIILPQRVIALEAATDVNVEAKNGHVKVGFTLWWDKIRKPSSRSVGSIVLTHNIDNEGILVTGEARFNNPSLERELAISGRTMLKEKGMVLDSLLDLDVFKKENQKIIIQLQCLEEHNSNEIKYSEKLEIKSKGQNIDIAIMEEMLVSSSRYTYTGQLNYKISKQPKKEAMVVFDTSMTNLNVMVKLPSAEILHIESSARKEKDGLVIDSELSAIGLDPLVIHTAVQTKGLAKVTSNIHKKNTPNNKLMIMSNIDDVIGVKVEHIKGGEKRELVHVSISTKEESFLKTDFGWSTENIRKLMEEVRQDISKMLQKVKKVVTEFVKQLNDELITLGETLRKNQPNIKRLLEVGQQQMKLIRTEIENDEVLHAISENLQKAFGDTVEILEDIIKEISGAIDAIYAAILKIEEILETSWKNATPAITEAWKNLVESVVGLADLALAELSEIISEVSKLIQAHEEELKHYLSLVTDIFQDAGKIVLDALSSLYDDLNDFAKLLMDEIESLNIIQLTKEKLSEIVEDLSKTDLPAHIWGSLREILGYIKEGLPTDEVRDFVTYLEEFIDKVINKEPVDRNAEMKIIYQKLVKAIKSVITVLRGYVQEPNLDVGLPGYKLPVSMSSILDLPHAVAVRFSPISYLISEDLPDLQELYYTYRPTVDPLDWIPPFTAYGILVDSNNFFTFDNRHYRLTGSCSYVLAQDYHDSNFSLVINLEGGQLQSIGITDGTNCIEIMADRSLKVGGAPAEYPASAGQLMAWRQYNSAHLKSNAGVHVHCHTDSNLCIFEVSGFYFARTRGLLGTINYEPWDDFMVPNGHVATKSSDFVNAWKLNPGCPNVPDEPDTGDSSVSECADIFSGSSDLRTCFPFINPAGFRAACNDAARNVKDAEQRKNIACTFASSYVELCKKDTPVVRIPSFCAHCSVIGGNKFNVGETISLKVPQRSADVVILVEQNSDNAEIFKELITPLVPTLTNDLKTKGINDVKFYLIGYGAPGQEIPAHYTSGGTLGFGGKGMPFPHHETPANITVVDMKTALDYIVQKVDIVLKDIRQVEAFVEATKYPFRVGAVKTIVAVIGNQCEKTTRLSPVIHAFASKLYNELGIANHLITPVEDIAAEGKEEKQIKQLVGFDHDATFSLSDAKKKILEGDHEFRKHLEYSSTVCTEATQMAHGAVFNSNNFLNAKPPARKQFLQVISHRIADSLTSYELTEDCTCALLHGVHASPVCRVKSRREKEHTKTKGVKG